MFIAEVNLFQVPSGVRFGHPYAIPVLGLQGLITMFIGSRRHIPPSRVHPGLVRAGVADDLAVFRRGWRLIPPVLRIRGRSLACG
jgi:hypothetical protein